MSTGTSTTPSCRNVDRSRKETRKAGENTGVTHEGPTITAEFGEFAGKVMGNGMLYKKGNVFDVL